jgi:anhydro-N-acetylmuramic acid kinase
MDAIDAAIIRDDDQSLQLINYEQYPIPDEIRIAVKNIKNTSDIDEISRLDFSLGHLFADAATKIITKSRIPPGQITAIGNHGQTVLHMPEGKNPRTLQIGDSNIVARETGITTVSDFRRMDMAAGGQGAPLAPAFHSFYFRATDKDRVILNIGGIANITILPADPTTDVTGFDTGPGNGLMDDWNRLHNRTSMDKDGNWSASGKTDNTLLNHLMNDPYFGKTPPKSTGRDYFNLEWLDFYLSRLENHLEPADIQATLLVLSAKTIGDAIINYAPNTKETLVCGGGVHNKVLMDEIKNSLPGQAVTSTENAGLDPDCIEAVTFAWLAKCRIQGKSGNLPSVTGAKNAVMLGAIYEPGNK